MAHTPLLIWSGYLKTNVGYVYLPLLYCVGGETKEKSWPLAHKQVAMHSLPCEVDQIFFRLQSSLNLITYFFIPLTWTNDIWDNTSLILASTQLTVLHLALLQLALFYKLNHKQSQYWLFIKMFVRITTCKKLLAEFANLTLALCRFTPKGEGFGGGGCLWLGDLEGLAGHWASAGSLGAGGWG